MYYGKAVLNLISRLKELISLDAWFILVFDGRNKPVKVRRWPSTDGIASNKSHPSGSATATSTVATKTTSPTLDQPYTDGNEPDFLQVVLSVLRAFKISYIIADGEGEAYCCYLQTGLKLVDFVWSNDSDCLVFGSTRVLKNYSKSRKDVGVTLGENINNGKESFITVVDFEDLVNKHGMLNQRQLLFFSVLMGNDYSNGIKGLGKNKAFKLATLRSPNFSTRFYQIVHDLTGGNMAGKHEEYMAFQREVFAYCREHSTELFGRDYSGSIFSSSIGNFEGWPDISIVMHLARPLAKRPFYRGLIEPNFTNISGSRTYRHINFHELKVFLQAQFKLPNITNFDRWFHDTMHEMFLVKFLMYEFSTSNEHDLSQLRKCFKITSEKTVSLAADQVARGAGHQIELWLVRYNTFLSGIEPIQRVAGNHQDTPSPTRISSKKQPDTAEYQHYLWVPKKCLPDSHILVIEFRARERIRRAEEEKAKRLRLSRTSPRRRFAGYKQTNNLDNFLKKHATSIGKGAPYIYENKLLDPVKKRLFVDEDNEDVGHVGSPENDVETGEHDPPISENEECDESLIILGEVHKSEEAEQKSLGNDIHDKHTLQIEQFLESPLKRRKFPEALLNSRTTTSNFQSHIDNVTSSTAMSNFTSDVIKSQQLLWSKVPFLSRTDTFTSTKSSSVLDRSLPSDLEALSSGTSDSEPDMQILDEVNKPVRRDEKSTHPGVGTEGSNAGPVDHNQRILDEGTGDTDEANNTVTTDFFSEGDSIFFEL